MIWIVLYLVVGQVFAFFGIYGAVTSKQAFIMEKAEGKVGALAAAIVLTNLVVVPLWVLLVLAAIGQGIYRRIKG